MAKKKTEETTEEVVENVEGVETPEVVEEDKTEATEVAEVEAEAEPVEEAKPVDEVTKLEELLKETEALIHPPVEVEPEVVPEVTPEVIEPVAEGHTQEMETPTEWIVNSLQDVPVLDVSVLMEKIGELYTLQETDPDKLRYLYETCRWNCIRYGLPLRDLRELFAEAGLELK